VESDTKHAAMVLVAAVVIIAAVFIGVSAASGVSPPQTIVVSESMQHGMKSHIGVIDTGDLIVVKDKNKVEIRSYVDGYNTGYEKFGNYGDVIIYNRDVGNPVIHRAILWLDLNGDGTWSAPSLGKYPKELWSCTGGDDYNRLSGMLTMEKLGYGGNISCTLNLDALVKNGSGSGFITMGDNNRGFDQPSLSSVLVSKERIKSVAWFEIPWVGVFSMIRDGKLDVIDKNVPNTIPSLAAAVLLIVFLLIGISFLIDHRYYLRFRKEMENEIDAPTPIFPLENEKE